MLKIFSFFAGAGFLDLGFEMSGDYKIQLVNELSPAFLNAYKYSRKKLHIPEPTFGYSNLDVVCYLDSLKEDLANKIKLSREDGSLVGFIGGPPCPDFSVAGKQRGVTGDNGKLTLSYMNLIILQKPDFFLFENVKGLWKTAKHRRFYDQFKQTLNTDYALEDRLCNALEFSVPQDRDRIFLFGIKKNYLETINQFPWNDFIKYDLKKIKQLPWSTISVFNENSIVPCPNNIIKELTVQHWFDKNLVDKHSNSNDYFKPKAGLIKMQTIQEGDCSRKCFKRLHRWRYSPTVAYGNNEVHLHPYKARRLSVAEAMSLQSLPKEFELPADMTLTDKFKTIGNGVPFLMSLNFAKIISTFIKGVLEK